MSEGTRPPPSEPDRLAGHAVALRFLIGLVALAAGITAVVVAVLLVQSVLTG